MSGLVTLVAPLTGLLGVALGWGLNLWSEERREQRRWAREDRLRFHDRKLAACEEFYSAAKQLVAGAPRRERTPAVQERIDAIVRSEATISFLAGPGLQKTAHKVQIHLASGWQGGVPDRVAFYREANEYLNAFKRAVRSELGTPLEDDAVPVEIQEETTA